MAQRGSRLAPLVLLYYSYIAANGMYVCILRRAIHRAGVVSTLEPRLRKLPGLEVGAYGASRGTEAAGLEARGDILLALESGMSVVDVSITHPSGVANRAAAATTDGTAAARREGIGRRGGRTAN
jgi:hypothetical protein